MDFAGNYFPENIETLNTHLRFQYFLVLLYIFLVIIYAQSDKKKQMTITFHVSNFILMVCKQPLIFR